MTNEEMKLKIKELTEENQRLRINFEKEKKNIPTPIYSPYPIPCGVRSIYSVRYVDYIIEHD